MSLGVSACGVTTPLDVQSVDALFQFVELRVDIPGERRQCGNQSVQRNGTARQLVCERLILAVSIGIRS